MKYYTYQHIRKDKNEVFYIGIGTRSNQDLKYNTYTRAKCIHTDNSIWLKIIAKAEWYYEIIFESDSRLEVEQKEIELIKKYGRKINNSGTLANMTLGGESNLGYIHTLESRKKISEAQKGKPGRRIGAKLTKEQRERMVMISKEVSLRPEVIERRRKTAAGNKWHLGHKHSEEARKIMSVKAKLRGVHCITVGSALIDKINNITWNASSLMEMSRICPLSIAILNSFSQGRMKNKKRLEQYTFIKNKG